VVGVAHQGDASAGAGAEPRTIRDDVAAVERARRDADVEIRSAAARQDERETRGYS
jgi:hypothetical protein